MEQSGGLGRGERHKVSKRPYDDPSEYLEAYRNDPNAFQERYYKRSVKWVVGTNDQLGAADNRDSRCPLEIQGDSHLQKAIINYQNIQRLSTFKGNRHELFLLEGPRHDYHDVLTHADLRGCLVFDDCCCDKTKIHVGCPSEEKPGILPQWFDEHNEWRCSDDEDGKKATEWGKDKARIHKACNPPQEPAYADGEW